MAYFGELRVNWQALTAASIGLAFGYTLNNYVTTIIAPHLIADFGWAPSNFALLGLIVLVAVICQPIAGRLVDTVGVRKMALIGIIGSPLLFLALSAMTGEFWLFYLINVIQVIIVGGTTSLVVYTRLIATGFDRARGLALGIAAGAPAIAGIAVAPLLGGFVDSYGWRTGYVAIAVTTLLAGIAVLFLIPKHLDRVRTEPSAGEKKRIDYRSILRHPAFWVIAAGMLLCNLTLTMQMSQIKILLLDRGVSSSAGSLIISLYAAGVIAGRLLCGVALDRFPPHLVATIAMSAPAIGLFMLASGVPAVWIAALAVAILGLSLGAEGDVGAYLVMKYFPTDVYSSVYGLVMAAFAMSGAIGAVILSYTLQTSGTFTLFLTVSAISALVGGSLFLLLGRRNREGRLAFVPTPSPGIH